ncbi:dephospho-CoA kinase [Mangrovivirga sp. M17]|uniref:Dephospho-CoA kinase n=1 Tax=Mangrovivirga halotolerans TaxID=2993936 RepID=A0ABT3RSQ7_9BACT|nr:dephospho-CoA kinase [Mangrovivirga halotolerans]MCX2744660.1 dephospho-CoA kinase [Mangrovivirga halotolerans]
MKSPKLIGVTGGIGAGKSTVCKIFSALSVPVYDADSRAKALLHTDSELKKKIIEAFGEESYNDDGTPNRAYLAGQVFSDEEKTKVINSLVHPAVGKDFQKWVDQNNNHDYLIKEAALLFEAGSYKSLDFVIHVSVPKNDRLNRVLIRDPERSKEQVLDIMDRQWGEGKKKKLADLVVFNDNKQSVLQPIIKLHDQLTRGKEI